MKTADVREKQKVASRNTRISELNRLSFCTETVEWKCGGGIRVWGDGVSPLRRGCGDCMILDGDDGKFEQKIEVEKRKKGRKSCTHERKREER